MCRSTGLGQATGTAGDCQRRSRSGFYTSSGLGDSRPRSPLLTWTIERALIRCLLDTTRFIHVFLVGALVLVNKVLLRMLAKPIRQFRQFFAEAIHRLLVHVGLRNKFRQADYKVVSTSYTHEQGRSGEEATKKSSEMFCPVRVTGSFVLAITTPAIALLQGQQLQQWRRQRGQLCEQHCARCHWPLVFSESPGGTLQGTLLHMDCTKHSSHCTNSI